MATRLDFDSVYDEHEWVVLYSNTQGYQEQFLESCKQFIRDSDFPNVDAEIMEIKSGGIFFNKEVTPMLAVSFKGSQFKKLGIYFRAQVFGNVIYYTLLSTVDKNFWDSAKGRSRDEVLALIRSKCKNWAQVEEFQSLNALGRMVFTRVMEKLDPDYAKNRQLDLVASR